MASKNSALLCVAILVSSLLIASEALPATRHLLQRLHKRSGIRLCGRMLVDTLATICQSEYYAPEYAKRNRYAAYDSENWDSAYPEGATMDSQNAFDIFRMNQLTRRGVADECCVKSCSIGQLFSYCGRNPGK